MAVEQFQIPLALPTRWQIKWLLLLLLLFQSPCSGLRYNERLVESVYYAAFFLPFVMTFEKTGKRTINTITRRQVTILSTKFPVILDMKVDAKTLSPEALNQRTTKSIPLPLSPP